MKRGRKPFKFGKNKSVFLSHEAIHKASELSENLSALVEALILKEWSIMKERQIAYDEEKKEMSGVQHPEQEEVSSIQ